MNEYREALDFFTPFDKAAFGLIAILLLYIVYKIVREEFEI